MVTYCQCLGLIAFSNRFDRYIFSAAVKIALLFRIQATSYFFIILEVWYTASKYYRKDNFPKML